MPEHELTLEELSERSGVEPRTLRSWISEGLLSPPFKAGRGATYPATNANRALAVRALKNNHGLSLAEIRRRFMMAKEEQIAEWVLEAGEAAVAPGSARDYIRKVRARERAGEARVPPRRHSSTTHAYSSIPPDPPAVKGGGDATRRGNRAKNLAVLEQLILQLEGILPTQAPRRSRGATWTRIAITPDLEISIRGDLEPRERVLFELLADQLRAFLSGSSKGVS